MPTACAILTRDCGSEWFECPAHAIAADVASQPFVIREVSREEVKDIDRAASRKRAPPTAEEQADDTLLALPLRPLRPSTFDFWTAFCKADQCAAFSSSYGKP
jgi:hypothetical protein